MANKNSVLLFGDYGTEVIRLSQLYDPDKCLYRPVKAGDSIEAGKTYYSPELRNKTVFFDAANLSSRVGEHFTQDGEYYYKEGDETDTQEGRYVPATQTLVVVDEVNNFGQYTILVVDWVEDADEEKDKVLQSLLEGKTEDEKNEIRESYIPTYRSHLKPINFTGGVDQATRAVDYNNDQLMLYVEDIVNPNNQSETIQKLVPDRKLMMYGPRPLVYVLRQGTDKSYVRTTDLSPRPGVDYFTKDGFNYVKFSGEQFEEDVVYYVRISSNNLTISTNSYKFGRNNNEEVGHFITACGIPVTVTSDPSTFEALNGFHVEWYDEYDQKHSEAVVVEKDENNNLTEDAQALYNQLKDCCDRGFKVTKISNSDDLLTQVQIPVPCYLRSSLPPLTSGQLVTIEIYEIDEESESKRLITSVVLHTRTGASLELANDNRTLVGFEVSIPTGQSDASVSEDLVLLEAGTTTLTIVPTLLFDDGSSQDLKPEIEWSSVSDAMEISKGLYVYGLKKLTQTPGVNTEFDVLFKYYPSVAAGIGYSGDINTRYEKTTDEVPSPLKQYFVKNATASQISWELATDTGYFENGATFDPNVDYYERKMSMVWGGSVARPSNPFLSVRKRIRIVQGLEGTSSSLRHISTIPVWNNETCSYDFKFLVYDKSYKAPKLIGRNISEDGYIDIDEEALPFNQDLEDAPETVEGSTVWTATLRYKPSSYRPAWTATRTVMLEVRKLTRYASFDQSNLPGRERFLIGGAGTSGTGGWDPGVIPYGRANTALKVKNSRGDENVFGNRPRLECWTETVNGIEVAKFQIPVDTIYGFPNMPNVPSDCQYNWFYWQFYRAALDADDTWEVDVTPNCFRLRAAEPGIKNGVLTKADDICSNYIPITSNAINQVMAYASAFECPGIRIPKSYEIDGEYEPTIAIVEFAYKNNDTVKSLIGVPVEIVRITHNPAEETL